MFLYFHLFPCLSREAEEFKMLLFLRCLICIKRGQEEGEEGRGPETELLDVIGTKAPQQNDLPPPPRGKSGLKLVCNVNIV
jgi:hypothetical protein